MHYAHSRQQYQERSLPDQNYIHLSIMDLSNAWAHLIEQALQARQADDAQLHAHRPQAYQAPHPRP